MTRILIVLAAAVVALAAFAGPASAQDGCQGGDRVITVQSWGHPRTTFSDEPATSHAQVQSLFARYENDLRKVLELAGFQGNADDLFSAVAGAREGDGTITPEAFAVGSEFEWMAFRKGGKPACVRSVMWKGKAPFPGWKIKVVSDGWEYTFAMPEKCLNLAFQRGEKRPLPPPVCQLTASFDPETNRISVTGKTSNGASIELTSASGPSGALTPGDLGSSGGASWSLQPQADGSYSFTAVATSKDGVTTTCSAEVAVKRKRPVCAIDASVDPETGLVTVSTSGSVGEVALTGMTMHDGGAGDVGGLAGGGGTWTYDPSGSLPRKPGDYSYTFAASSKLHGFVANCEDTAVVTRAGLESRWIVRGYYANLNTTDDKFQGSSAVIDGPIPLSEVAVDSGSGFGLGVEYLLNRRVGVELDALFADFETHFMFDRGALWIMNEADVDFETISVGVNFHLTPDKRFDLYVGPFVSLVSYGDAVYITDNQSINANYDDDTAIGAKLGLDVPFSWSSPWVFTTGIRYLPTTAEPQTRSDFIGPLDVDPLIGWVGLGYRF